MLRALLILLALCLPLPAAAMPMAAMPACHDMAMGTRAMNGVATPMQPEPADQRKPATADHLCIGCAPPSDWLRAPLAAPLVATAMPAFGTIPILDLGRNMPPALPPPQRD